MIRLFDTMLSKWTLMNTEGESGVLPRMKAASVLSPSKDYISEVYILDVTNYTWVTSFDPNYNSSTSSPSPSKSKKGLAIGIGIGAGLIFIITISIGAFIFYKRRIRNRVMKISGNTQDENEGNEENGEIHN
ncbi:7095_t:CDS:2 [Diversispora eburnea]|uniref:7095_t:CDS:1 n=1 Tax=Diversispora eburnea TaxID=1213867 RepID=A0A9N8W311_9GLOM|nr:7095_t:CDS:2 [Diversispora eburnea]